MKYDAILVIHCFQPPKSPAEVVGMPLSGWAYEDTKTDGNHPFPNGQFFTTTTVQEVVSEGGLHYVVTKNTTYLIAGTARNPEDAQLAYMAMYKPRVSLTGDPVNQ